MCLALFAHAVHPRYALVLAANRDEFHDRAAAPAAWIAPNLLAGRDLRAGGGWLVVRRDGRFALVTNVRDPARLRPGAPSRGALPLRIAGSGQPLLQSMQALRGDLDRYDGVNLLAGAGGSVFFLSTHAPAVASVPPGLHGLSNHLLDTPWPKVERGRAALADWLKDGGEDFEGLFRLLGDRQQAADADLPATGVPIEWERRLSAAFIVSPDYGTRCSTVLLLGRDGEARLVERSWSADGSCTGEADFRFSLAGLETH